jgi:hypothetical protein
MELVSVFWLFPAVTETFEVNEHFLTREMRPVSALM